MLKEIPDWRNLDTVSQISVEGENRGDTETLGEKISSPAPSTITNPFIFLPTSGWNYPELLLKNKSWCLKYFLKIFFLTTPYFGTN